MNESNVFIILYARRKLNANSHGQAGRDEKTRRDERSEWRIGSKETLSDRRICHIDQQITTVYIGGKESSPSTDRRAAFPSPPETFSISYAILYPPDEQAERVYMRMYICVITGGTICYVQYVFAASYMFPRVLQCAMPCQYAPDEYRPTFYRPHSKVSPARAYPCNLVYLRIVFIRVSTINWPLEALKSPRLRARTCWRFGGEILSYCKCYFNRGNLMIHS